MNRLKSCRKKLNFNERMKKKTFIVATTHFHLSHSLLCHTLVVTALFLVIFILFAFISIRSRTSHYSRHFSFGCDCGQYSRTCVCAKKRLLKMTANRQYILFSCRKWSSADSSTINEYIDIDTHFSSTQRSISFFSLLWNFFLFESKGDEKKSMGVWHRLMLSTGKNVQPTPFRSNRNTHTCIMYVYCSTHSLTLVLRDECHITVWLQSTQNVVD